MKILIINPIISTPESEPFVEAQLKLCNEKARPNTKITLESILKGPASIESEYDELLAAHFVAEKVKEVEKRGFDAAVISCFGDPGLAAAREITDIPVVGAGEAALMLGMAISDRIGVVTTLKQNVPRIWRKIRALGISSKVLSVRASEIPVLHMGDRAVLKKSLVKASKDLLNDGAGAIVLGCTGMAALSEEISHELKVPVVDPLLAAFKVAESLVDIKSSGERLDELGDSKNVMILRPIKYDKISSKFESVILKNLARIASSQTRLIVRILRNGPKYIESSRDEHEASVHILKELQEIRNFHALIINCFIDPALGAARELLEIPVLGAGQSSMIMATFLGNRFSIVTLKGIMSIVDKNARLLGLSGRVASIRPLNLPVSSIEARCEETERRVFHEAEKAIKEDGADVVVLGCTGMTGLHESITEKLKVPVVDPTQAALKMAEIFIEMGLSHSKLDYPKLPEKKRIFE